MGESRHRALAARQVVDQERPAQVMDTLGGRMHIRWDNGAAATPHGLLVFFAEFLAATGVFKRWVSRCPVAVPQRQRPGQARRAVHADAGAAGRHRR